MNICVPLSVKMWPHAPKPAAVNDKNRFTSALDQRNRMPDQMTVQPEQPDECSNGEGINDQPIGKRTPELVNPRPRIIANHPQAVEAPKKETDYDCGHNDSVRQ